MKLLAILLAAFSLPLVTQWLNYPEATDSTYQGRQTEPDCSRAADQSQTRSHRGLAGRANSGERVYPRRRQQIYELTGGL